MLNVEIGIKNKDIERFREYCEVNKLQVTYEADLGNCLFVNVSIDAAKVDVFIEEFSYE